jgi:hypothetical protein
MNFEVKPFGSEYFFEEESNVEELFYTYSGLRIIIETQKRKFVPVVLEVYFRYVNAFRCLDEGDLSAYRESGKFKTPHHIFEIHSGGWSNGNCSKAEFYRSPRRSARRNGLSKQPINA